MQTSARPTSGLRLGADVGGTFTDLVLTGEGGYVATKKILSTPHDFGEAIVEGLKTLLDEQEIPRSAVGEIVHGTTVATNAILEKKGARTGTVNRGFRDVLEIRRLRMPQLYNLLWQRPQPLVERSLRQEVDERLDPYGQVLQPIDLEGAAAEVQHLVDKGVESLAVCLLHSYANPAHEQALGEVIRRRWPGLYLSLSSDVLPQIREYERTSSTVVNAYIMPVVKRYIESLVQRLKDNAFGAHLLIMQSNGGIMTDAMASQKPAYIIESGPAAGVIASNRVAAHLSLRDVITFDMGGTTAKASMIEDGTPHWTSEFEVGAGISISSRLITGGGYALNLPVIDLSEVGAGGGSIIWIDSGGAPQVGPQSAGAAPGPVCYNGGGTEPTVTDANIILGYLNPTHLLGGAMPIEAGKAKGAFADKVAQPLGLELLPAAYGAYELANSNMIRAVKAVSSQRGRDPRQFAMLAFGGGGPLHAAAMARALDMRQVIVPPSPGVFSAYGLLYAEVEHHLVHTYYSRLSQLDLDTLNAAVQSLEREALAALASQGYGPDCVRLERWADLRYVGQSFELRVPLPTGRLGGAEADAMGEAFSQEHERTYGHRAHHQVEMVNLRVVGRGLREGTGNGLSQTLRRGIPAGQARHRPAYFGPQAGLVETAIMERSELSTTPLRGPIIVEEYDSTVVVPPDCSASVDEWGNIVIQVHL